MTFITEAMPRRLYRHWEDPVNQDFTDEMRKIENDRHMSIRSDP